jgi:hypothetical protein
MLRYIMYLFFINILFLSVMSINAQEKKVRIDVIYFHATIRCHGCLTIEDMTKNSINSTFGKELKDSLITYTSLDFLQTENEHYQDDYKFDAQTLIISKKIDGKEVKWKNLDKIWDLSSDYDEFHKYVEEEVRKLLNES